MAAEIGFPLIVKAAFGGGGRGMRVVEKAADFEGRLEEARREAAAAFGNDAVFHRAFHAPRAPYRSADSGRSPRQYRAPLRARLLRAAAPSESRGSRAGGVARRAMRAELHEAAVAHRARSPAITTRALSSFWWTPIPASGISSRSIRAFRWSTPSPKWSPASTWCAARFRWRRGSGCTARKSICRRSTPFLCMATRCNAASRRRIRPTISCRTTGASPPIVRLPGSAFAWTEGRHTAAPSSRHITIRCW